jgi:hypothetical protein
MGLSVAIGTVVAEFLRTLIAAGPRVLGRLTVAVVLFLLSGGLAALYAIFGSGIVLKVLILVLLGLGVLLLLACMVALMRRPTVEPLPVAAMEPVEPLEPAASDQA